MTRSQWENLPAGPAQPTVVLLDCQNAAFWSGLGPERAGARPWLLSEEKRPAVGRASPAAGLPTRFWGPCFPCPGAPPRLDPVACGPWACCCSLAARGLEGELSLQSQPVRQGSGCQVVS